MVYTWNALIKYYYWYVQGEKECNVQVISCHSNFSLLLSSEYLKRNIVVSMILVEKTGLSNPFILFCSCPATWNTVFKYIQSWSTDYKKHFTNVRFMLYMETEYPYCKHQNVHFRWLPWQHTILSYLTYCIQETIFISMFLDKRAIVNVFLKIVAILPIWLPLSDFFNDSNIVVSIATVHPILLKPFLWIPKHVLGHNNFDLWEKTLNMRAFSNIGFGHSDLGRHLEYFKLLKSDNFTPP